LRKDKAMPLTILPLAFNAGLVLPIDLESTSTFA
jgi:hypothetical protein